MVRRPRELPIKLRRVLGVPLEIFTQLGDTTRDHCEASLEELNLKTRVDQTGYLADFQIGVLGENLYEIPHDSLVVLGSGEHTLVQGSC